MDTVYIVGRFISVIEEQPPHAAWELMGVFTKEGDAVLACTQSNDFVGPIQLNKKLPEESISWPRVYYPLENKEVTEDNT